MSFSDPNQQQQQQPLATASHPPASKPDPTTSNTTTATTSDHANQGGNPAPAASASELSNLKMNLRANLRQFPDFPSPGVLFEDIMPLFANPSLHASLIRALELQLRAAFPSTSTSTNNSSSNSTGIDVLVGLESRGFLFGPTLALQLGAAFVPVRKKGKLPGECETEGFQKEYGSDLFQMQKDAIKPGQKVVVVDDIIATGGSAAAAGRLVNKLGGNLLGYVFLMELDFLKGRAKLDAPVHTLLSGQEEALKS